MGKCLTLSLQPLPSLCFVCFLFVVCYVFGPCANVFHSIIMAIAEVCCLLFCVLGCTCIPLYCCSHCWVFLYCVCLLFVICLSHVQVCPSIIVAIAKVFIVYCFMCWAVCHDWPKIFVSCGPSRSTSLVSYPTVAPTVLGISAPQNSITTLGVQPMCASPTPTPISSIKEQLSLTIAAPQPSHLIIPPDVTTIRHPIRNPSPLQVDQYMSSPLPPIPNQAVCLGGDDDATMSSLQQSPPDHLPYYYQG